MVCVVVSPPCPSAGTERRDKTHGGKTQGNILRTIKNYVAVPGKSWMLTVLYFNILRCKLPLRKTPKMGWARVVVSLLCLLPVVVSAGSGVVSDVFHARVVVRSSLLKITQTNTHDANKKKHMMERTRNASDDGNEAPGRTRSREAPIPLVQRWFSPWLAKRQEPNQTK